MEISVVLPLFGNAATVEELLVRLASALPDGAYEIIGVDDASPDAAAAVLQQTAERLGIPHLLLHHHENRGQNQAVLTGLARARGAVTVLMDADLQDPPEVVPQLVDALRAGAADVAFALRRGRHAGWPQFVASRVFKRLLFAVIGVRLPPHVGLFLALQDSVRRRLLQCEFPRPYLLALVAGVQQQAVFVPYERAPRPDRGSGYSWTGRLRLAWHALACAWRCRRLAQRAA